MNIKELRNRTGLSQNRFSELLDIPLRSLQDWESGRRTPPEYLVNLVKYFVKMEGLDNAENQK